jgi:hypothetical protein
VSVEQHTPFAAGAAYIADQPQPRMTVPARCVLGGQGTAPTPEQYALAALGACETNHLPSHRLRLDIPMARTFLDPNLDLPTRRTAG